MKDTTINQIMSVINAGYEGSIGTRSVDGGLHVALGKERSYTLAANACNALAKLPFVNAYYTKNNTTGVVSAICHEMEY